MCVCSETAAGERTMYKRDRRVRVGLPIEKETHCAGAKSDRLLLTCGRPQFQFADRMLPDKFISKRSEVRRRMLEARGGFVCPKSFCRSTDKRWEIQSVTRPRPV